MSTLPDHPLNWRKSKACVPSECVEVASRQGYALVRDSADDSNTVLCFAADQWQTFTRGLTE